MQGKTYCVRVVVYCCICVYIICTTSGSQIVTVLDHSIQEQNPKLIDLLQPQLSTDPNMSVIVHKHNDTLVTFQKVCQEVEKGAEMLLDISSPDVGPLLRSFARAHGLVFMTVMDESLVLPVDFENEFYIQIQPPGADMLNVVADIVTFDNLTNVAILYDDSFNLNRIPRRIVSGVLSHHIYQQIHEDKMVDTMTSIQKLEIENVFIIAAASNVEKVLSAASLHLQGEEINWFVITKDAKIECLGCRSQMRVVVADGVSGARTKDYVDYIKMFYDSNYWSFQMKVDEVFAYDLVRIFRDRIPAASTAVHVGDCYGNNLITNETLAISEAIMQNFEHVNHDGVYGRITSKDRFIRQEVQMNIKRVFYSSAGKEIKSENLGTWTDRAGLNLTVDSLTKEKSRKNYRVVVIPSYEPFIYRDTIRDKNGSVLRHEYRGLCIDLFKEIASQLDFSFDMYESEDGYFGSLNDDGTWNGAIHELIEKKADIAVGPISVMSERENVVDFTVPFHEPVGLTILMKKQKFEYILHKFLTVLEPNVWICIVASFFLFSVLMWLFDKFSPYSYQNNPDSSTGPEKRIFTLKEGIWFCMTSLTPQGGGEAPKAISGRLVAATWWLYGFLLIAFYTANLAATLTVTRLETPIESLEDLSKQQSVRYGPVNGSAALVYFTRMKQIEEQFYQIWKDMSLNDSLSPVARAKLAVWDYPVSEQFTKLMGRMFVPSSSEEATRMVRNGEFAFIDDASRNDYQVLTDCDVEVIGEEFSRKPFAFAVVQGSPLRAQISNVILELANNRVLEDLTNRWWDSNELHKECPRLEDESDGISIKNIGGVFLVIAIGTGLSLIAFVCEYYYYKIRPKQQERAYKIKNSNHMSRLESEISLDSIQVQQNGGGGVSRDPGLHRSRDNSTRLHEGTTRRFSLNFLPFKGNNNGSHKRKCNSQQDKHHTDSKDINHTPHANGHSLTGIVQSIFTYENKEFSESRAELYPSLHDNGDIQAVFSDQTVYSERL